MNSIRGIIASPWRPIYALQLAHEIGSGQSGNYWIAKCDLGHPADRDATIIMTLYKDAAARAAGKDPMVSTGYSLSGADYDTYFAMAVLNIVGVNQLIKAYTYVKTLDGTDPAGIDFSSALDV